jgi:CelD/BcsL family acetyltransferase involved in cellulose biosynthesis
LASWWRSYGVPGGLRLVLVRADGRLVAAAPMMLLRRCSVPVLTPIGGALSDFGDVLIDERAGADAGRRLTRALLDDPGWQAIDVPETRPDSAISRLLAPDWPGRHADLPASLCLELAATPTEQLVRELPGHARKTVRRRLNQIDRLGVRISEVPPEDAGRAVADLLALHARQWQGRGGNPEHQRARFADHLTGAVGPMIAAGQAALLEYRVGDLIMACSLVIIGPDLAGGYLYGADPDLRDRVDVLTLLVTSTIELAHRRGCSTMSMLRGAEPYKLRWRPRELTSRRLLLARPGSIRGIGYVVAVRVERAALRSARDRLPWLRAARDRVRATASLIGRRR